MNIRHILVLVVVASLVVFGLTGCGGAEDTAVEPPAEPPAAEQESAVGSAEDSPEAERPAVPADYDDFLAEAAAQANFTFYVPSEIPPDFSFLPEESTIDPDNVGIVFASDEARLWLLQGAFDTGEEPREVPGVSATFGPLDAALFSNVGYWSHAAEDELYGALGEAVIADDGRAAYMVFGTGVSRVYTLSTARDMVLYE